MGTLERVLEWRNLRAAWYSVADNHGAPGLDRVSVGRFARYWGANLYTLAEQVRKGRYGPGRLRRVAIPKRSGGQRLLRIPSVGDRVLQRAVLNVIEPRFERRFLSCSHGYRRKRGVRTALDDLLAQRDRGLRWVLDADIDACFDSIDHALLRGLLEKEIRDPRVLHLLDLWLRNGEDRTRRGRGLALGMPVSPLLCNIVLHELDTYLVRRRWPLVRYADDFVVCCASESEAEQAREVVAAALAALRLQLEPTKTRVASFDDGFEFLGIAFENNEYSFLWEGRRFTVEESAPRWLWAYAPSDYPG